MQTYVNSINKLTESTNLVEKNLKFALKIAHKYKGNGVSIEDLVQEANYGLVIAAQKFDPEKGVKFLSFAVHYIRKYVLAALGKNRSIVSEPGSFQHKARLIRKAESKILTETGNNATTSEIMALTGYSKKAVLNTMKTKINSEISIDKPLSDESDRTIESSFNIHDEIQSPSDILNKKDQKEQIKEKIKLLNKDEAAAIHLRFFEDYTLNEIAIELGMTPPGISGVIKRALKKMKF